MVFNEFYNAENPDIERTCEFIAIEKITTEFCVKILKFLEKIAKIRIPLNIV